MAAYFITLFARTLGVFSLGMLDNHFFRGRSSRGAILFKDYTVMSFGGLRGAIAFALAFLLVDNSYVCSGSHTGGALVIFKFRGLFLTTTIALVLMTVVIQGTLTGDLLNFLHTKRQVGGRVCAGGVYVCVRACVNVSYASMCMWAFGCE